VKRKLCRENWEKSQILWKIRKQIKIRRRLGWRKNIISIMEAAWPSGSGRWIWYLEVPDSNPPATTLPLSGFVLGSPEFNWTVSPQLEFLIIYVLFAIFVCLFTVSPISTIVPNTFHTKIKLFILLHLLQIRPIIPANGIFSLLKQKETYSWENEGLLQWWGSRSCFTLFLSVIVQWS